MIVTIKDGKDECEFYLDLEKQQRSLTVMQVISSA